MTAFSPADVCKRLGISPSTLRKYSLQFEKHGIIFKRNHNNSRLYTDTELVALREAMTATKNGDKSLENAVSEASDKLKGVSTITQENAVTSKPPQRHDDDATADMLKEIRGLRQELKDRDYMFVEALERMQQKIDRLEEQQQQLIAPDHEEEEENSLESQPQTEPVKQKGFFSRLFKK